MIGAAALSACGPADLDFFEPVPEPPTSVVDDMPELDVEMETGPALPLNNGTLAVAEDGSAAVACDPEGDAAYVIGLGESLTSSRVTLEPGTAPGRVVMSDTHAYVLSQRTGAIVVIELASAQVVQQSRVCRSPEGAAIDGDLLHVACRDGALVTVERASFEITRELRLDDDLRDVLVFEHGLVVSRFRTAELIFVNISGTVSKRVGFGSELGREPGVAWKAAADAEGNVVIVHQMNTNEALGTDESGYSGGGGLGDAFDCGSAATTTVSVVATSAADWTEPAGEPAMVLRAPLRRVGLPEVTGTVDLSLGDGGKAFLAVPGNGMELRVKSHDFAMGPPLASGPSFIAFDTDEAESCLGALETAGHDPDVTVGVATVHAGRRAGQVLTQTRDRAQVKVDTTGESVVLHEQSRGNTALTLFQMNTGGGISCATCHPLGRTDAHTWNFEGIGPRRTQSLEGGVSRHGAFHWEGDMESFEQLVDEVMSVRMGLGFRLSAAPKASLLEFLDEMPAPPRQGGLEPDAVRRGHQLFQSEETQCSTCHSGSDYTDNAVYDVGTGGRFITPSLIGVASRTPLMHDGCAPTIEDRFQDDCGGSAHGQIDQLTEAETADLVVFLRSL